MKEYYKKAYDLYVKEGRAEADRLFESGCMVNYRELEYSDFVGILESDNHRYAQLYKKTVNEYYNRIKKENL